MSLELSLGPNNERKNCFQSSINIFIIVVVVTIPYQWKRLDFLCSYQAASDWPKDKDFEPEDFEFHIQLISILTTFTKLERPVSN